MVVDDEEKANILNTFFSTVFTVENEMLGEIPRNNENPILRVTNLTQEEVRNRLNKIKIDKSPGPDGIHPRVLRELSNPVPFCTSFHRGISDGTVVIINGSILPTADRLAVNFQCGPCDTDDIAFHFNPRFDQKTVVCNTMQNKNWGTEEVKSELPFYWGLPFELRILVTSLNYKVSVNGLHYLEYRHRISLQRVNTLIIGGPLCLTSVEIQPQGPPPCNPCPFHIDLNFCGGIAFHFNPRFNEKTIVRNSMLNNSWGKEELELHCGGFCFAPGQSFVIEIICEHHHFRVNVNGNHVCNFNYRVPNLQQINSLGIGGDVVLQHVQQTLLQGRYEWRIQHQWGGTALTVALSPARHTDCTRTTSVCGTCFYTDRLTLMGLCNPCAPTNTEMSPCLAHGDTVRKKSMTSAQMH
ncbi:unnamed protein product [Ranitomeya imitator]|uniref:Galectin n=1 Tax=Ranitomeya imitator TaxID=111125 RepID=A0ABN9MQP7_9NEOB|nr:unnamed protein product [Ranitomeya imitator]